MYLIEYEVQIRIMLTVKHMCFFVWYYKRFFGKSDFSTCCNSDIYIFTSADFGGFGVVWEGKKGKLG